MLCLMQDDAIMTVNSEDEAMLFYMNIIDIGQGYSWCQFIACSREYL